MTLGESTYCEVEREVKVLKTISQSENENSCGSFFLQFSYGILFLLCRFWGEDLKKNTIQNFSLEGNISQVFWIGKQRVQLKGQ